eukprot:CAMPEP_0180266314 /NCGR_PEP_ID=MMETSP0988-20121125/946_1 /TAXON_ID=697907 /ORGANISM="non described non described, Strain CCMP2293" /LENGTH=117 /DNA_ID=CAMNT_0022236911 /DNA_START=29 /DNA_END=379 /DNA_ORIENTATION=-
MKPPPRSSGPITQAASKQNAKLSLSALNDAIAAKYRVTSVKDAGSRSGHPEAIREVEVAEMKRVGGHRALHHLQHLAQRLHPLEVLAVLANVTEREATIPLQLCGALVGAHPRDHCL